MQGEIYLLLINFSFFFLYRYVLAGDAGFIY